MFFKAQLIMFFSVFRKRGRNLHEDEVEFMPLSKRINNLHINNGLLLENSVGNCTLPLGEWGPGPPYFQNQLPVQHNIPETPPGSVQSIDWCSSTPQYTPELNEAQNPYYFNINKLLFEMYIERLQRNGQV